MTLKRRQSREASRSRSQSWEADGEEDLARAIAASLEGAVKNTLPFKHIGHPKYLACRISCMNLLIPFLLCTGTAAAPEAPEAPAGHPSSKPEHDGDGGPPESDVTAQPPADIGPEPDPGPGAAPLANGCLWCTCKISIAVSCSFKETLFLGSRGEHQLKHVLLKTLFGC